MSISMYFIMALDVLEEIRMVDDGYFFIISRMASFKMDLVLILWQIE